MKRVVAFAVLVCIGAMPGSLRAEEFLTTKVKALVTDGSRFGGCIAYLEHSLSAPECQENARYVSFDCLGTSGVLAKATAQNMYGVAQLAYVTGNDVYVGALSTVVLNGVCLASRINALEAAP